EIHTDLQVRQTGFAALGVERQSIADRLADDTDPIASRILDESCGGDSGGKSQRGGEDEDVTAWRQQAGGRVREAPGVGVIATSVAPQIQDYGARWIGAESGLGRREKGRNLLSVRVRDTLQPHHLGAAARCGKQTKVFVKIPPRLRQL